MIGSDVSSQDRVFLKVVKDADFKRSSQNQVSLSPKAYHRLFGKKGIDGQYVKVSNFVFRAFIDKTPAFIEGLVSEAVVCNMRRIAKLGISPEDIADNESAKLTLKDFQAAYSFMTKDDPNLNYLL